MDDVKNSPPTLNFLRASTNPRHLGRLGAYEILDVIGRGGMGVVLKARDSKLERLVAIKVLSPELASSGSARTRFMREAKSAAAVTNDHVVTIHAVEEANGVPFLVMEYIVGVSLEDRIQRSGQLRVEEVLRIGAQAASGLAAAHAQGLVHRDIKPSNILLENGVERVKITDFGLARVAHEAQATSTNLIAGTPQYMSPEQARGEPVDHRSDLFSLGAVLYAMCVGRSPFRAETPSGAIHRVCNDTPRAISELNPDIPDWLGMIINRLLEKQRDDRFQSASEVADILGSYLAHVQQPSRVALPSLKLARSRRSRKSVFFLAAAGGVFLLLAGLAALWFAGPGKSVDRFYPVSLASKANRSLTDGVDAEDSKNHLGGLRVGDTTFDGVPFRIDERYMQLQGVKMPGCPSEICGIAVNRRAATLHFLHGSAWTQPSHGATVAKYIVHYDDGSTETVPVISGRHVQDWYYPSERPQLATRATAVLVGTKEMADKSRARFEVFQCVWQNPHPKKVIATLDFTRGDAKMPNPFCLAITCDQTPSKLPPEPGLLVVQFNPFAGIERFSLVIDGDAGTVLKGSNNKKYNQVLLPQGRHTLEIRDGDTTMRRGSIDIESTGVAFVAVDIPSAMAPLPGTQPTPASEMGNHVWGVAGCSLSKDGSTLAVLAFDGTLFIWKKDGLTWKRHAVVHAHSPVAKAVAISPTGQLVASAGEDGSLKLWDSTNGSLVVSLKKEGEPETGALAFSPDGHLLASGNADGTVDLWDIETRQKIRSIRTNSHSVRSLAFSPDGTLLAATATQENSAVVWDLRTCMLKYTLRGHTGAVIGVAFSPNGRILATCSQDTTLRLWDLEGGRAIGVFESPDGLHSVAFSSDGQQVAAAGSFRTVCIWDVASQKVVHDFQAHWAGIRSLVFTPDNKELITAALDNSARVWLLADLPRASVTNSDCPHPVATFRAHSDWSVWIAYSSEADGKIACMHLMSESVFWNLNDFSEIGRFKASREETSPSVWTFQQSISFVSPGSKFVTCLTRKRQPEIGAWNVRDFGQIKTTLCGVPASKDFGSWEAQMVVSRDGKLLAVTSPQQSRVMLIDSDTLVTRWSIPSRYGWPSSVAFSHDDRILAVGVNGGMIMLLNAETGEEIHEPLQHGTKIVTAVAFSPDGKLMSSVGQDRVAKLWDLPDYKPTDLPSAHKEKLVSVAFQPGSGALMVTTGGVWVAEKSPRPEQGEICLWDTSTRKLVRKFSAHFGCVTCAVFSPDGKRLATTGRDGRMHLWDVADLLHVQ
jgi:WD40 repeat protein/serine/threonine protein kinase